jgi:pimeloyl-ACP methyl ester carboxylesterase
LWFRCSLAGNGPAHTSVGGLQKFLHRFVEQRNYNNIHLMGNSLGGHVALVHILKHPQRIKSLILTGSSGLFENGMGDTYPSGATKNTSAIKQRLPFMILHWQQKIW